jgi:hypothetical protein
VVENLRKLEFISDIGLWGRSMGAGTILQYLSLDQNIKCVCLDSAFYDFPSVIKKFLYKYSIKVVF